MYFMYEVSTQQITFVYFIFLISNMMEIHPQCPISEFVCLASHLLPTSKEIYKPLKSSALPLPCLQSNLISGGRSRQLGPAALPEMSIGGFQSWCPLD